MNHEYENMNIFWSVKYKYPCHVFSCWFHMDLKIYYFQENIEFIIYLLLCVCQVLKILKMSSGVTIK